MMMMKFILAFFGIVAVFVLPAFSAPLPNDSKVFAVLSRDSPSGLNRKSVPTDSFPTKAPNGGDPVLFPRDVIPDSIPTKSDGGEPVLFNPRAIPDSIPTKSDGITVVEFPRDVIPDSIATKSDGEDVVPFN